MGPAINLLSLAKKRLRQNNNYNRINNNEYSHCMGGGGEVECCLVLEFRITFLMLIFKGMLNTSKYDFSTDLLRRCCEECDCVYSTLFHIIIVLFELQQLLSVNYISLILYYTILGEYIHGKHTINDQTT